MWYEFLKGYKAKLEEKSMGTGTIYNTLYEERKSLFERDKKVGFLNKDEIKANEHLINKLSETEISSEKDIDAAFEEALSGFENQRKILEESEDMASEQLENVFTFIEETLGAGQEMVVFVTELTMNSEIAMFLSDNPSEKYLKYNSELLVGTKKEEIMSKLRKDEIYSGEHIRDF